MVAYNYIGSGGAILSNPALRNYNATLDFGFSNQYTVYGTGDPDLNIDFNTQAIVSAGKFYWYRVLGYCRSPNFSSVSSSVIDDTTNLDSTGININNNISSGTCNRTRLVPRPIRVYGNALVIPPINITPSNFSIQNDSVLSPSSLITSESDCDRLSGYMLNQGCYNENERSPVAIIVVSARDLGEVCRKLNSPSFSPKFDFNICSIQKFTTPINESSGKGIAHELEDQTYDYVPECLEFTIDFDFTKKFTEDNLCNNRFAYRMSVYQSFYHEFNLSLETSGQAKVYYLPVITGGFVNFSFAPTTVNYSTFMHPKPEFSFGSEYYLLDPLNCITVDGTSNFLVSPYIFNSSVNIELTGSLENLISPVRKHNSLLSISLISQTRMIQAGSFKSYNLLSIFGSAFSVSRYNYSHDEIESNIELSGTINLVSNKYFYESKSDILIGGTAKNVISGFRYYLSVGGIELGGSPQKLGRCFVNNESGEVSISGNAETKFVRRFKFNGEITVGGIISNVLSPSRNYSPIENYVNLSGEADNNFTNLGLLVTLANFTINYSNASLDSTSLIDNINNVENTITLPSETISSCGGCSTGLSIDLFHNISRSGVLSEFLIRNSNVKFDENIVLRYRARTDSWINTQTLYSDKSPDSRWQIIFEISCTNLIDNETLQQKFIKFNFYATYKGTNTNLVVYIDPNEVCQQNGTLSTTITRSYSLDSLDHSILIDSVPTNFYKFFDDIGIFTSKSWNNELDYSRLRPKYYDSAIEYKNPLVRGVFPEFKINFNNIVSYMRRITLDV